MIEVQHDVGVILRVCTTRISWCLSEFLVVHGCSIVCDELCACQQEVTGCSVIDVFAAGSSVGV